MNIYLDIDGVLLNDGIPAKHVDEFLGAVLSKYPNTTYWLTTRCNGTSEGVLKQIKGLFVADTQALLKAIKPTTWPIVKTQAIDFSSPFLWFDDQLGWADKKALEDNDAIKGHVRIDLKSSPSQLQELIEQYFS